MKKMREAKPLYVSVAKRAWRYGITAERFTEMLDEQGWSCALCRCDLDFRTALVDHDHECCPERKACGKCVRGILCNRCNAMLGMALDDPDRLRRAAEYLERNTAHVS